MPAAITNGEAGSSVRSKINTGFTELATAQADILLKAPSISPSFTTPALGTPSAGVLTNCTGLLTAGMVDGAVTLAKMANLAQDQFIGRTTASTGVPQTATITAAARTVLDDTTVAAMVDTLGGATSTGTGGIVRANSPTLVTPALGTPSALVLTNATGLPTAGLVDSAVTNAKVATGIDAVKLADGSVSNAELQYLNGVTSAIQTQLDGKLSEAIATDITATKAVPLEADEFIVIDTADSDAPKLTTAGGIRSRMATIPIGTALGTTGSVALDFSTLLGTRQSITATGNITFTTSNLAAGRGLELRIGAGGSTRTLTWPAWVAFGAALPTSLASGATLIISLFANSTTDASVDAVAVVSA